MRLTLPYIVAGTVLLGISACFPLDPLGDGPDQRAEPLSENTFAGNWRLANVERVPPPFDDVDSVYLDGELPETISFEIEGNQVRRHRVLLSGEINLKPDNQFRLSLEYGTFTPNLGRDTGPLMRCSALLTGRYDTGDGLLNLTFASGALEEARVFEDGTGALRLYELPNTCSRYENQQEITTSILLSDLVFVRDLSRR